MKELKVYRSVWRVVVLSGKSASESRNFEEMVYAIDEGEALGSYNLEEEYEVKGKEAVRACEEVGNDGSFFAFLLGEEEAES